MILLQTFNKLEIVLAFKINQDFITENYCVNKDKPQMHCEGKCVLAKKLKQAEQNEEKQRMEHQEKANVLFFCKMNRLEIDQSRLLEQAVIINACYLQFKPSGFVSDIFKPPKQILA